MASVNQVFDSIEKEVQKAKEIAGNKSNMSRLAKTMALQIRKRTRLGRGVSRELGNLEKLKPLSDSYVQYRKGRAVFYKKNGKLLAFGKGVKYNDPANRRRQRRSSYNIKVPKLSPEATPKRSNLTFSGKLLDSIFGYSPHPYIGIIAFRPRGTSGPTNDQIVEYNEDRGRPFFYLSKPEYNQSLKFMRDVIQRQVELAAQKLNTI